jgi:divalent metal cation (Fe/Co/Zn/Cd) transporter
MDVTSAILFSLLFRIIYRKSRRFSYGIYNLESIAVLFTSLIILYLAIDLLINTIYYNKNNESLQTPLLAVSIIWISVIVTLIILIFETRYSWISLVKVDIIHSKFDIFTEIISSIAVMSSSYFINLITTLIILTLLFFDIFREIREAFLAIIGAPYNSPIKYKMIKELTNKGLNVMDIKLKRLGSFDSVKAIIGMNPQIPISEAYKIRKLVKRTLTKFENVALVEVDIIPTKKISRVKELLLQN